MSSVTVTFDLTLKLSEVEARALDAIAGYSLNGFLTTFYKEMGKSYLQPHEQGIRLLFMNLRTELPQMLKALDTAKEALLKIKEGS